MASHDRLAVTPLLTDLYQLTMLHAYFHAGMEDTAVFEFFVRRLPSARGFLVTAGQEQVVDFLTTLRFDAEELQWLRDSGRFDDEFVDRLADLRFSGDVDALPEGTLFFADEPVLRVTATLPEAQLIESRLINLLHLQTTIASKAARCRLAAPDKLLVDFGMRRAHGAEAALLAARAAYIAGFDGTATVLAGQRFGIPLYGTMAHSFVQCHDNEVLAFRNFAAAQRSNVVLLIDTYDTLSAARDVVGIVAELARRDIEVRAVRLDSGDVLADAFKVRSILDAGGCDSVAIFASGSLDETRLAECVAAGAPIDGFGVGTKLDVSADAPYLDCAYKLQEYAGRPRRKRSAGKATWPGRKQVWRRFDSNGLMCGDIVTLEEERVDGEALLQPLMRGGRVVDGLPGLDAIRVRVRDGITQLPESLRRLEASPYPVEISVAIQRLAETLDDRVTS